MNSISPQNNNNNNNQQQSQVNANPQARQKKCSIKKQNAISDFSMTNDGDELITSPTASILNKSTSTFSTNKTFTNNNNNNNNSIGNNNNNISVALPSNKAPSLTNLNIPTTIKRKMSLQQQQQPMKFTNQQHITASSSTNNIDQQATVSATTQLNINNNNAAGVFQRKQSQSGTASSTPNSMSPIITGGGLNNLSVNSHLMPRKSVIGSRLERSSFQAQRLSDVGVAVGQQLTAKIGLKLPASQERIVEQTRWLYLRYVFSKLRQNNLPLRDLNLTKSSRARRANALGENTLPEITCSAPGTSELICPDSTISTSSSTAPPITTTTHPFSISGFKLGSVENIGLSFRKRATKSQNIDREDLTILTNRMKSLNNNDLNLNPINRINNIDNNNSDNEDIFKGSKFYDDNNDEIKINRKSRKSLITTSLNFNPSNFNNNINNISNISGNNNQQTNRKFIMDTTINNQIFTIISNKINELRELKPEYYGDTIYELVGIDKFSSLQNLLDVQMTICQEMTRSEISWCRIAALFSLFGAMSLDCVRLGAPEHVGPILEGFIGFVERDLALWISQQGGWESFLYKHKSSFKFGYLTPTIILTVIFPILIWLIIVSIFR